MTSTTTRGIPYPDPTDPVTNGDDAIKALAQWLDANVGQVQSGSDSITPSAANTTTSKVIVFPVPFAVAPDVVVSVGSTTNAPGALSIWVGAITTTQVTINVQRTSTTAVPFRWMARG